MKIKPTSTTIEKTAEFVQAKQEQIPVSEGKKGSSEETLKLSPPQQDTYSDKGHAVDEHKQHSGGQASAGLAAPSLAEQMEAKRKYLRDYHRTMLPKDFSDTIKNKRWASEN